jgi:Peptidase M15
MRRFFPALLLLAAPAAGQTPLPATAPWQPTAPYVILGQDEPGYRNWYASSPRHPIYVKAFNDYLTTWGVAGTVPTWQLLRSASDWMKCGAAPFEVPPSETWPNVVQTLRYIREKVIPAVGPVEPVSVYRNPVLNQCAGGAEESAHRFMQAVDMVPLLPITREELIRRLCTVHARSGEPYGVGLGFYVGLRFHIDSRKFRKWGYGDMPAAAAACMHAMPQPLPTPVIAAPPIAAPPSKAQRGKP